MTRSEIIRFLVFRSVGNFLLLFAIFGVLATFGPTLYYEVSFRLGNLLGVRYSVAQTSESTSTPFGNILRQQQQERFSDSGGFSAILSGKKEQVLIPKDPMFSILIPKVGANQVITANVDPTNEKEFLPVLYRAIAHAKGTVFPGMNGNIYLFAHSTDNFWDVGRYNAIFYLIKDLAPGDDIVVFFENRRHNYTVTETKIIDASEVIYLVEAQSSKLSSRFGEADKAQNAEQLILQTCWPPGTTWKRLVVFAKPK